MDSKEKSSLPQSIFQTLGLFIQAIVGIIKGIFDFLFDIEKKRPHHDEPPYQLQEESPYQIREVSPYHLRDDFLSQAELSFFLVLKSVVSEKAVIFTKVDLGDLFYVKSSDPSKFRIYTNKIDRKHVDYLLCDLKTVKPLLGIELDDKSHQKSDRQARDEFVEKVFKAANLPLLRIRAQRSYSLSELETLLRQYIGIDQPQTAGQPVITEKENTTPLCPKCGTPMVLRTAKTGTNQGGQFWGCPDYPRCRGILKYEAQVVS